MKQKILLLTQKALSHHPKIKKGFALIEIILAIALFAIIITSVTGSIIYAQQSTSLAGNRARAVFLAEEGLEEARSIRDAGFSNLTDGTHGLAISGNVWTFSGSSDSTDIYTRQITISSVDENTKLVTCTVTWQQNAQRTGTVTLKTHLTNWNLVFVTENPDLYIDASHAQYTGAANKTNRVWWIWFWNLGSKPLTIDKIKLEWTSSGRRLDAIAINAGYVWTATGPGSPAGKQSSGALIDISNVTIYPYSFAFVDYFEWDGSMTGNNFTLTVYMSDGSTKSINFTPYTDD